MSRNQNAALRRSSFPPARLVSNQDRVGRTRTSETPLRIKVFGLSTDEHARGYICQHAGFKLGKFALHIKALDVRLKDESGPHGEPLATCTLSVDLDAGGFVVVVQSAHEPHAAFDLAIEVAERSVRRTLQRMRGFRRTKPSVRGE